MSLVSDFHDVNVYNGKNKPLDDTQRLCVITFKTDKKKAEKQVKDENGKLKDNPFYDQTYKRPDARCISIPKLGIRCEPAQVQLAMQDAFNDIQDALIRKLLIAKLDDGETVINFHKDQIGFDAIAAYAAEVAASGKLTKEAIADWFDADVGDALTLALANAMKLPEQPSADQEKQLAAGVTKYRDVFCTLAAPKAGLSPTVAKQLQKVLECAANKEDRTFVTLEKKVKDSLEAKDPELIGL